MSLSCWNPHRWLRAGDSRMAALPAVTDFATCAKVKSMNRFACSTLVASRPARDCKPRTALSARKNFGPPLCPGIATSRALLKVEQSTAQMAAPHESTRVARACWTFSLDKSWCAFSSQSIGSTRHPHHARAYVCDGCVLTGEYIQGIRRPVSVSSREFASLFWLPFLCWELADLLWSPFFRWGAAGLIRWDLPVSCGRLRQDLGVSPVVHCRVVAPACISIGLGHTALMGVVALPRAVGTLALVESTAQPGAVAQGVCSLLGWGLHWWGLGGGSRDRLALGIRPSATGRLYLPDLRSGQLPHSLARLQNVLDDLTQRLWSSGTGLPRLFVPPRLCAGSSPQPCGTAEHERDLARGSSSASAHPAGIPRPSCCLLSSAQLLLHPREACCLPCFRLPAASEG